MSTIFHILSKAARMVALLFFFIFSEGCHIPSGNAPPIGSIRLIVNYPVVITKERSLNYFNLCDTIYIFKYQNRVLYRLPARSDFSTGIKIKNTETYFIYENKDPDGYLFASLKDSSKGKELKVDSFLSVRAFSTVHCTPGVGALVETNLDKKNDVLQDKYVPSGAKDESSIDSVYYYYTGRLNTMDYTFSKELDSSKGKKLFKARLLINQKFSDKYNMTFPKREYFFEIDTFPISDAKEIYAFIERFESMHAQDN